MGARTAARIVALACVVFWLGQAAVRAEELRYVSGSYLNLRVGPGLEHASQGLLPRGTAVSLLEVGGVWCRVRVGAVQGWVSRDYLVASPAGLQGASPLTSGWIRGNQVNVRSGPSKAHRVRAQVNTGERVDILACTGQWYLCRFVTGLEGWVAQWLVKVTEPLRNLPADSTPAAPAGAPQSGIVSTAKALLGVPYAFGGASPSGFDCSGFVYYVFAQHGCPLPHSAAQQYQVGLPVSAESLLPGDVVFFRDTYKAGVSHSGIYLGDGQFIHASSAAGGVVVTPLAKDYYAKRFVGGRRMR